MVYCRCERARVKPGRRDDLDDLIHLLFRRRRLVHLKGTDSAWQRRELVRELRARSRVYQTLSTEREGPIPFALGYFRIADDELQPVAQALLDPDLETMVRVLSEFLEPGARLLFDVSGTRRGWLVAGEGEVEALPPEAAA